jgi:hypothetical protein
LPTVIAARNSSSLSMKAASGAGADGVEEPADEAAEGGAERDIADLPIGESGRAQPVDVGLGHLGGIPRDLLRIGQHLDLLGRQAGGPEVALHGDDGRLRPRSSISCLP